MRNHIVNFWQATIDALLRLRCSAKMGTRPKLGRLKTGNEGQLALENPISALSRSLIWLGLVQAFIPALVGAARKRGRVSLSRQGFCEGSFLGRPRERSVESRHSLRAVRCNQAVSPKGIPRTTERRTAFNSASVSTRFTWPTHSLPAGTGQAANATTVLLCTRCHKLHQRHSSARSTSFARNGFRST